MWDTLKISRTEIYSFLLIKKNKKKDYLYKMYGFEHKAFGWNSAFIRKFDKWRSHWWTFFKEEGTASEHIWIIIPIESRILEIMKNWHLR